MATYQNPAVTCHGLHISGYLPVCLICHCMIHRQILFIN